MDSAQLTELFVECGPLVDAVELNFNEEESIWAFRFQDEPPCVFRVGERPGHVVLSGEIAPLPAEGRLALYEMMLQYNDHAAITGGLRLSIEDAEGAAKLSIDLGRDDLNRETVAALVPNFREIRRSWVTLVTSARSDATPADEPDLPADARVWA